MDELVFSIGIAAALFSGVLSAIVGAVTQWLRLKAQARRKQTIENAAATVVRPPQLTAEDWRLVIESVGSAASVVPSTEVQSGLVKVVDDLSERLGEIEGRFPNKNDMQFVSSVNEAVMATRIQNMEAVVQSFENKILTKWDVVVVVFAAIAAITAVIGVIFGALTFLSPAQAITVF